MASRNQTIRAVVARQEDLLHRPREVVEALQGLGLRRNSAAFRIIENLRTGYAGLTRDGTLLQEKMDEQTLTLSAPIQELIASRLVALRAAPFMAALGYAMPQQSSSAEHTEAPRTRARTDVCGRAAVADGA